MVGNTCGRCQHWRFWVQFTFSLCPWFSRFGWWRNQVTIPLRILISFLRGFTIRRTLEWALGSLAWLSAISCIKTSTKRSKWTLCLTRSCGFCVWRCLQPWWWDRKLCLCRPNSTQRLYLRMHFTWDFIAIVLHLQQHGWFLRVTTEPVESSGGSCNFPNGKFLAEWVWVCIFSASCSSIS